jgi:hypothetical protein
MGPDYETDFYGWCQAQAAAIRAGAWHEEVEDLWKAADHDLTALVLGFLELCYRPSPADEGNYYWQSAVIDFHRSMLESALEDSPRLRPMLAELLAGDYAWARTRVMGQRTPPRREPPEACPWTLDELLDERWWPPEAPARLP